MKLVSSRKKNLYKIYHNDEFLGCVPQKLIPAEYFLQTDIPVPDDFIQGIKDWVYKNACEKLLDYLAKMERTVYDCKIYLKKLGIPDSVIAPVVKEAEDKKWVSDKRYAELYTEDAISMGRSPLDIKHKLKQKRISPAIINKAVDKLFNQETQDELIEGLIDKMLANTASLSPRKQFEKIATALYRKGFQYQDYEGILSKKIRI
jgi:SOS response regulatory protein OraA/RecX